MIRSLDQSEVDDSLIFLAIFEVVGSGAYPYPRSLTRPTLIQASSVFQQLVGDVCSSHCRSTAYPLINNFVG